MAYNMSRSDLATSNVISVCLFFTFGMNLRRWDEAGILDREVCFYKKLVEHGVDVTFFTYGDESERGYADRLPGIKIIPAWSKGPTPKGRLATLAASLAIPWIWKHELAQHQILKTNQMWGAWIPLLAQYLTSRPVLLRCGYEAYKNVTKGQAPALMRFATYWLSRWAYGSADKVAFTYHGAANFAGTIFGPSPDKVVIQPNYVDIERFSPCSQDMRHPERALFVGRVEKEKNLSCLIKAMSKIGLGLDIVGAGSLVAPLKALAKSLGVDVRFLGIVPYGELSKIMVQYPVLVLPSCYENHPKVLLEAMSCGMAVVGTDVDGIREMIDNGENGLLCEPSAENLANCIERIMQDKKLRERLGSAARSFVVKNFSLHSIVKKEIEIYRQILGKKKQCLHLYLS